MPPHLTETGRLLSEKEQQADGGEKGASLPKISAAACLLVCVALCLAGLVLYDRWLDNPAPREAQATVNRGPLNTVDVVLA